MHKPKHQEENILKVFTSNIQIMTLKNAKVSIKPTYQYAATTPIQVELNEKTEMSIHDNPPSKVTGTTIYTKLFDIENKTYIDPEASK